MDSWTVRMKTLFIFLNSPLHVNQQLYTLFLHILYYTWNNTRSELITRFSKNTLKCNSPIIYSNLIDSTFQSKSQDSENYEYNWRNVCLYRRRDNSVVMITCSSDMSREYIVQFYTGLGGRGTNMTLFSSGAVSLLYPSYYRNIPQVKRFRPFCNLCSNNSVLLLRLSKAKEWMLYTRLQSPPLTLGQPSYLL